MPDTNSTPSTILIHGEAQADSWRFVDDEAALPAEGDVFVSLERFEKERDAVTSRLGRTGVVLEPGTTGRELDGAHDDIDAIAVHFPKFTDGRGYTIARRLRDQLGWNKQLRAFGDVLPDQVFYMQRCGFDTLAVRPDKSLETARACLAAFSVTYQGAADDPRPLYARRESFKSARAS